MTEPRPVGEPVPGFYLVRLVRKGPMVAAEIYLDADKLWWVAVNGEFQGPSADPWLLSNMERVALYGRACEAGEAHYRLGMKDWALRHKPEHPAANPTRAVNPHTVLPI